MVEVQHNVQQRQIGLVHDKASTLQLRAEQLGRRDRRLQLQAEMAVALACDAVAEDAQGVARVIRPPVDEGLLDVLLRRSRRGLGSGQKSRV